MLNPSMFVDSCETMHVSLYCKMHDQSWHLRNEGTKLTCDSFLCWALGLHGNVALMLRDRATIKAIFIDAHG